MDNLELPRNVEMFFLTTKIGIYLKRKFKYAI